ncbi:hypothetical protein BGZ99_001503 [Dissophora globulifera]|uniref:Uncharacterized protein n=1 Tax=Dissophora globulifera TaxID=979702 RepID=A0A9P6RPL1_9FUNG|nr:hypothetical protein BGZ99_001503 [Dissophora globulifera]
MSLASATKDTSAGQASSEGSAVYELFVNTTSISTLKVDVSETTGVPYHPILKFSSMSLSTATPPKIVRLTDSGPYDVVVVGSCASPTIGICLTFIGALEASTLQTPMPYDPTSCIVHANGSVIVATTSGVWTYPYAGTLQPGANWTAHQAPGLKPNLPSPILACATSNSKLYAILQGDEETPSVRSIDMTTQNWDWQAVQLIETAGSGTIPASPTAANGKSGAGNDADVSGNKNISSAVIAVIIAVSVIIVLLILMALIWRYRRIRRKNRLGMGQIDKTIVAPAPSTGHSQPYGEPSTTGAAVLGSAGHHQPNATYNSNASDSRTVTTPSPTPINTSRPWTPQGSFTATSVHTPLRSAVIAGDKEEIDNEDQHWRSESAASSYTSNISHGIVQHPGGSVKQSIAANNNPRMQQALSPGLTNAQLILQQSQAPKNSSAPPDSNYYRR